MKSKADIVEEFVQKLEAHYLENPNNCFIFMATTTNAKDELECQLHIVGDSNDLLATVHDAYKIDPVAFKLIEAGIKLGEYTTAHELDQLVKSGNNISDE